MQNTKRLLRSNEILLPSSGVIETELDLSFSLQYPHFLKRDINNKLEVMLQRRKKYKNRTILGYKTLAVGQVNMSQVLQHPISSLLLLYTNPKDQEPSEACAELVVQGLTSQPVCSDDVIRTKKTNGADRSPDGESDDDEADTSSNDDLSDSDPAGAEEEHHRRSRKVKASGPFTQQRNLKQKFISLLNRFKISEEVLDSEQDQDESTVTNRRDIEELMNDLDLENLSESEPEADTISVLSTPKPKLKPFFSGKGSGEALEKQEAPKEGVKEGEEVLATPTGSLRRHDSDSNIEMLNNSPRHGAVAENVVNIKASSEAGEEASQLSSPAAAAAANLVIVQEKGQQEAAKNSGKEASPASSAHSTPPLKHRMKTNGKGKSEKTGVKGSETMEGEPRKVLLDRLVSVMPLDDSLPESLIILNASEWQGQMLAQFLEDNSEKVVPTCSSADVKATIACIVSRIQKFCNTNARAPSPIKVAIAGGDSFINNVLWPYVEQFSSKSPDWQNYVRFLVIPLGTCSIAKYLCQFDAKYGEFFGDASWRDLFEKSDNTSSSRPDGQNIADKVKTYIASASEVLHLPIGEAMLTYCKDSKHGEEDSSQIFMPFLNEARIGQPDMMYGVSSSMDEEILPSSLLASTSPPASATQAVASVDKNHTPPNSPNVVATAAAPGHAPPPSVNEFELQIDYWAMPTAPARAESGSESKVPSMPKKDSKISLKSTFRSLLVYRLPHSHAAHASSMVLAAGDVPSLLTLLVVTKEKKPKIIRIGKKTKDMESKSQTIDGLQRLICSPKSQNQPLSVVVDGVEWSGVKFFQLSSQWQTHIKYFPVLMFNADSLDG